MTETAEHLQNNAAEVMPSEAPADAVLRVEGLVKLFADHGGGVHAVDGVSFSVPPGSFFALLGPSGCGKTTTLRCVAGLERPDAGRVVIGGRVVSDASSRAFVPANARDIGMVFQSYGIWPHMTVFENAAFPLRVGRTKPPRDEVWRRVEEALAVVQLDGFAKRNATQLSGGQQQRLALARALVRRPRLLLLDEPLSNLDAQLREAMRGELRDLQRRLSVTTLYVTHDQTEALSMADRIAVMDGGRIVQEGTPRDIYERPRTRFAAGFVGKTNFIAARVVGADTDSRVEVETSFGRVVARGGPAAGSVTLCVRPECVELAPSGSPAGFAATVETVSFLGETVEAGVRVGAELVLLRSSGAASLTAGDEVSVRFPTDRCAVLVDEG